MKKKRGTLHSILIIIGALVLIAFLFVPVIPTEVAYTVEEPYERNVRYEVLSATTIEKWDLARGVYHVMEVEVKNIDTLIGTFDVDLELFDIHGSLGRYRDSHPLSSGETHIFSAWWDTSLGQDVTGEYQVYPPTVTDKRLITRHKTEYKSIISIIFKG